MVAASKLAFQAGYDVVGKIVLVDLKFIPKPDDLNVDSVVEYE